MAYAFAGPARHARSHQGIQRPGDALDSARGIIAWTLLSALLFWVPLGIVLSR